MRDASADQHRPETGGTGTTVGTTSEPAQIRSNPHDSVIADLFRDPITWQALAILVALAIGIPPLLALRRRKALSYDVFISESVFSVAEEFRSRIAVHFDGSAVPDLHLLVIQYRNTGHVPIVELDYVEPPSLVFSATATCLGAEVVQTDPLNIRASLEVESNRVRLRPVLLNPGDSVTIKALVTGFDRSLRSEGRIVGVRHVDRRSLRLGPSIGWALMVGLALAAGFGTVLGGRVAVGGAPELTLGGVLVAVAVALAFLALPLYVDPDGKIPTAIVRWLVKRGVVRVE